MKKSFHAFEHLSYNNKFVLTVLNDVKESLPAIDSKSSEFNWPDDVILSEYQFYIQRVGFFLTHTLTWCKQLDLAIEFLANYDYSKKIKSSRADHLIYNIERG